MISRPFKMMFAAAVVGMGVGLSLALYTGLLVPTQTFSQNKSEPRWLLETAENMCDRPKETLETYLEWRDINDQIRDNALDEARKTTPALDSTLERSRKLLDQMADQLWVDDDRPLIVRLASQGTTPILVMVSRQELTSGPVASVGWIEFFYGPMEHEDHEVYFALTVVLLESHTGWGVEIPHYYESWIAEGPATQTLVWSIREAGTACTVTEITHH